MKSNSGQLLLKSVDFLDLKEIKEVLSDLGPNQQLDFERETNNDGHFQFHLKNKHGKVIGSSGIYSSETGMENGIKNTINSISFK